MSTTLFIWKFGQGLPTNIVLVYAETATEATEKIALYLASVTHDPAEVSMMQRYFERVVLPIPIDFSGGVAAFQIDAPPQR